MKPNHTKLSRIQTAPTGPKRAAPKQVAAVEQVPPGKNPGNVLRNKMWVQEQKWCAPCHAFLPWAQFSRNALTNGGPCTKCQTTRDRVARTARQQAGDERQRLRSIQNAPIHVVKDLPLRQLIEDILAMSANPREVQVQMLEECLDGKIERYGMSEGLRLWRECPHNGLEYIWLQGRR